MPCVIRKTIDGKDEFHAELAPGEWKLEPQVKALEAWLRQHEGRLDPQARWSADIGFGHRREATGGGPVISCELMRLCVGANLDLYLSEYGIDISESSSP